MCTQILASLSLNASTDSPKINWKVLTLQGFFWEQEWQPLQYMFTPTTLEPTNLHVLAATYAFNLKLCVIWYIHQHKSVWLIFVELSASWVNLPYFYVTQVSMIWSISGQLMEPRGKKLNINIKTPLKKLPSWKYFVNLEKYIF